MEDKATRCQFQQHFTSSFFCKEVFCTACPCLQFGFVIFLPKEISAKAACKLLVKLTRGRKVLEHLEAFCLRKRIEEDFLSNINVYSSEGIAADVIREALEEYVIAQNVANYAFYTSI